MKVEVYFKNISMFFKFPKFSILETSITFKFFFIVQKIQKVSPPFMMQFFSVNLRTYVFINKFCKKFLIQPSGEPREQRQGDV